MRRATQDDFDVIYDICMDPDVHRHMNFLPVEKDCFQTDFDNLLARDYFWVFEQDGAVYGFCTAVVGKRRFAHIASLRSFAVHPDFQGQGLGKHIVTECLAYLKLQKYVRIDITTNADNDAARQLYESFGFKLDGVMPKYFKRPEDGNYVDEVVMSLTDWEDE